jgi:hypothetical protein
MPHIKMQQSKSEDTSAGYTYLKLPFTTNLRSRWFLNSIPVSLQNQSYQQPMIGLSNLDYNGMQNINY